MDRKDILAEFGELLMTRVRDNAIWEGDSLVTGHLKGDRAELFQKEISDLSDDAKKALLKFVPEVVDSVLHYFLFLIEDEPNVKLLYKSNDGLEAHDLGRLSDGLAGELYSSEGWIARFSEQRRSKSKT